MIHHYTTPLSAITGPDEAGSKIGIKKDIPEINMRLQRAKPRAFEEFPGRNVVCLGVNHNNTATIFHHEVMKCLEQAFAYTKTLHLGGDAQPDCWAGGRREG